MIAWLRRALKAVEDAVWPEGVVCLICEERPDEGCLCDSCRARLEGLRIRQQNGPVRSVYRYAEGSKELVLALKFDGVTQAAEFLADAMAEQARSMELPAETVITWVAMPRGRRRARGIDHGRTLAEAVGRRMGLPVKQLLKKDENTRTQLGLTAAQRKKNMLGKMHALDEVMTPVLIVDDVITTGSTVSACAQILYAAGAPAVFALSALRVPGEQRDILLGGKQNGLYPS